MKIKKIGIARKIFNSLVSFALILVLTVTSFSNYLLLSMGPSPVSAQSCGGVGGVVGAPGVRPGGVALNQAATFLANMTEYTGAYYDGTLDRIVFIGKTNTSAPKFNKDDLAVTIKSVIFNNTIPTVSLETQPGDTNSTQPMKVVYSTDLEDTKFGQIILEADYKMKQYSQGYNADGSVLVSSVPGYKSFWQRYQENGFTPGFFSSRWWITPQLISLKKDDTTDSFIFDQVKMQILTEPTGSSNSTQWNNAAQSFAQQQTDLYDEFAKETPTYAQTKQLAKIVAVVKWIKDNGIVNNFEWVKSYQPEYNPTPRTKPRLSTPPATQNNITDYISGGANFFTPNIYTQDNGEAVVLKNASQSQSINKEDVHWTFVSNGQTYDSVAVEAEAFRSVGAYSTEVSDFSTAINDDLSLQVNRTYNSYSSAQNGVGKGWDILPVSLTQTYWGWDEKVGCPNEGYGYRKVALNFQNGNRESFEYRYCGGEYVALDPAFHTKFFIKPDGSYFARTTDQTEYIFDASLKLTQIKDKNGNKISYYYDGNSKLTQIKDDNNHYLNLAYNATTGLVNTITDWAGRVTTYGYDSIGNLTSVTDPKGSATKYTYDNNNRLLTITNRLNQLMLTNTYNADGRLLTQKDANGKIVTYAYDNTTNTVTSSDNQGRVGKTIFDNKVRVLREQDALNNAQEYTYGTEFAPLTVKDKKGNTSTFSYDANGNVVSRKDPAGVSVNFEYDAKNNVTKTTDQRYSGNKITSYSYDQAGNLVQTTEGSKVTKYSYNPKGQLIGVTDPLNKTAAYTRDSLNNILTSVDPQANITTYTYDTLGRLTLVKDPDNKTTAFTYDNNNNLLTSVTSLGTTTNVFNAENKLIRITEPNNTSTQLSYNANQSLNSVTDALSGVTNYGYDQYQNITSKQDALNRTTQFAYDKLNQRTQSTTPLGKVMKWEYDQVGNISKRIDSNNQTTTYEYDSLNRLKKINYPNTTNISYTYDNRGNLLTMIDPSGTTTYTYDVFDRLISAKDSNNAMVQYEYDMANNLTKITYPDSRSVSYNYDGSGRLLNINDWNGGQTNYQYNKNGTLSSRTYPNGIKTNYQYDNANKLTEVAHLQGNIALAKFNYTRNNLGNITAVTENSLLDAAVIPTSPSTPPSAGVFELKDFSAQYWNTAGGGSPAIPSTSAQLSRTDNMINFNWAGGTPGSPINTDNFVARWTKTANFAAGNYSFKVTGDDGFRLFIDGQQVINKWVDQGTTSETIDKNLTAGNHTVIMEYYENGGDAVAKLEVTQLEATITGFTGQYWNVPAGSNPVIPTTTPNLTRTDTTVNFDWGGNSPAAGINVDNFVARWTKTTNLTAGNYQFSVTGDDGVRLFIDGEKVIDKWVDQGPTTYTINKNLAAGNHTIIMEYYENAWGALAKLDISQISTTSTMTNFTGQYWNLGSGTSFTIPSTTPQLTRTDSTINFDWQGNSPDPLIDTDRFMAKWTKTANLSAGVYQFKVTADDGVRLYVDGERIIDKWINQGPTTYTADKSLTAGNHTVVMEYYEDGWGAVAKFDMTQLSGADSGFSGQYWNVATDSGFVFPNTAPTFSRNDANINFNWDGSSPDPSVTSDYFVARWTKAQNFATGMYQFKATGDDGVRLFIDGEKVLDGWRGQSPTTYSVYKNLTAGTHNVVMEYFEWGGGAQAKLEYNQVTSPENTQTTFAYDNLMRLITATYPNNNSFGYTYDKVGNRLTSIKQGQQTSYAYNNDNQLTTQGSTIYAYDNNGNRTNSTTAGNGKSFGYNFENKLISFNNPATGENAGYVYDGKGNRIAEKAGATLVLKYVNDNSGDLSKVLYTVDVNNNSSSYIYGVGLVSEGKDGYSDRKYYLEDGLGNTRFVVGAGGSNIQAYTYDAFGYSINGGSAANFQYKGEDLDDKTGLYFMRARYYDPVSGTFTSKDPVEGILTNPQTQNGYNFANGDSVNLSDPSGLAVNGVCFSCSAGAGGYVSTQRCIGVGDNWQVGATKSVSFGANPNLAFGGDITWLNSESASKVSDLYGKSIVSGISGETPWAKIGGTYQANIDPQTKQITQTNIGISGGVGLVPFVDIKPIGIEHTSEYTLLDMAKDALSIIF